MIRFCFCHLSFFITALSTATQLMAHLYPTVIFTKDMILQTNDSMNQSPQLSLENRRGRGGRCSNGRGKFQEI